MFDLASLGFTKEELQQRVIDACVQRVFETTASLDAEDWDFDGSTSFGKKLQESIKAAVNDRINDIAQKHVLPKVAERLESIVLQQTNTWGEKTGQPVTLIEYLVQRCDAYMREDVNYEGKSKDQAGGYSWTKSQSRITHLVHAHLHYSIESAMKDAIKNVNSAIAPALADTVKIKLGEIVSGLKVQVATK